VLDLAAGFEGEPASALDRVLDRARRPTVARTDPRVLVGKIINDLDDTAPPRTGQVEAALRAAGSVSDDREKLRLETDTAETGNLAGLREGKETRTLSRLVE